LTTKIADSSTPFSAISQPLADPRRALRDYSHESSQPMNRIYTLSRWTLAAIFFYHGLVPKILARDASEVLMNTKFMPFVEQNLALRSSGALEILFALALLFCFHWRLLNYAVIGFAIMATLAILAVLPELLTGAFNPVSTNLSIASLSLINLLSHERFHARPNEAPAD
jgi:uncharacterized membrane protein YphA (DoxX/SURF4 family)